jgi:hypothetical protein
MVCIWGNLLCQLGGVRAWGGKCAWGRGVYYDTMLVGLLLGVTRGTRGFPTNATAGRGVCLLMV